MDGLTEDASPSTDRTEFVTTPPSGPVDNVSAYQTPSENASAAKDGDKDMAMVIGAGKSLRTMLGDLMQLFEGQAGAQVSITGELKLNIQGRDEYSMTLYNDGAGDDGMLRVSIDKASPTTNGVDPSRKRPREGDCHVTEAAPKRQRLSVHSSDTISVAQSPEAAGRSRSDVSGKFDELARQIQWVEQCRRMADDAHHAREENWRTSSATFHDEQRQNRERHEAWMVSEMSWQRQQMLEILSEIRGLYPLAHNMKWEIPPNVTVSRPPPPANPQQAPHTLPSQQGRPPAALIKRR